MVYIEGESTTTQVHKLRRDPEARVLDCPRFVEYRSSMQKICGRDLQGDITPDNTVETMGTDKQHFVYKKKKDKKNGAPKKF